MKKEPSVKRALNRVLFMLILGIALVMPIGVASAHGAHATRPAGPPPPTGCTSTTETDDLVDGFLSETHYHLNMAVQLDGLFDSTTGALCDLRSDATFDNVGSASYTSGEAVWVCLQTSASGCGSMIAGSSQTWTTTIGVGDLDSFIGPWKSLSTSQCVSSKTFFAVAQDGTSTATKFDVDSTSWC